MFPERLTFSIADWVNAWVDALVTNYGDLFRKISDTLLWAIVNLEGLLRATPWWLLLAIVAAIAWHATRRLLPTLVITGLLFLVGAVGLWDKLMQTLALMLVATFISVLIGIPLGILAARSNRLRAVLAPYRVQAIVANDLPLLYVHAALIEQALINVLENAARFSPNHGRLRIEVSQDAAELRFAVSDEGPGIPEAEREKIFDMFYTAARGDRGGQGTGLGLAICQGMIGAHGGRISVGEGLDGRGTTLVLHLPLHPQPDLGQLEGDE